MKNFVIILGNFIAKWILPPSNRTMVMGLCCTLKSGMAFWLFLLLRLWCCIATKAHIFIAASQSLFSSLTIAHFQQCTLSYNNIWSCYWTNAKTNFCIFDSVCFLLCGMKIFSKHNNKNQRKADEKNMAIRMRWLIFCNNKNVHKNSSARVECFIRCHLKKLCTTENWKLPLFSSHSMNTKESFVFACRCESSFTFVSSAFLALILSPSTSPSYTAILKIVQKR